MGYGLFSLGLLTRAFGLASLNLSYDLVPVNYDALAAAFLGTFTYFTPGLIFDHQSQSDCILWSIKKGLHTWLFGTSANWITWLLSTDPSKRVNANFSNFTKLWSCQISIDFIQVVVIVLCISTFYQSFLVSEVFTISRSVVVNFGVRGNMECFQRNIEKTVRIK